MLNLITVIEYVNSFLLLTLLGIIYYICYKQKIFLRAINIAVDATILYKFNNLEKNFDPEFKVIKTRMGRKKKIDTKMLPTINEEEGNGIRDKRDRLVACIYLVTQNIIWK